MSTWRLLLGDVLEQLASLPDSIVQTVVTSPPYWGLRDFGAEGQIGLERTPEEYVERMVAAFREVRRVLRDDGTLWLNLGDSYAGGAGGRGDSGNAIDGKPTSMKHDGRRIQRDLPGLKPKDLVGIPWRVAFALQAGFSRCDSCGLELRDDLWPRWQGHRVCFACKAVGIDTAIIRTEDGWYLRSDIIWAKPNPMPEAVTDRPTKAHEYLFLLAKSPRYYYDAKAIRDPVTGNAHGRGEGVNPKARPSGWAAGSLPGNTVLDPFMGAGTTGKVAVEHGREFIGIELNPEYLALARRRIANAAPLFTKEGPCSSSLEEDARRGKTGSR